MPGPFAREIRVHFDVLNARVAREVDASTSEQSGIRQ
jgi:hypothetical protein